MFIYLSLSVVNRPLSFYLLGLCLSLSFSSTLYLETTRLPDAQIMSPSEMHYQKICTSL